MGFLKVLFIILIVLSCLIGIVYIMMIFLKKSRFKQISGKKLSNYALLHETICSELFRRNVFTGYFFPSRTDKNGLITKYSKIDSVVLTKGGVAVITICDKQGRIDNSGQDIWVECLNDKVTEFENPLLKNENNKKIIYEVLRKGKLRNIPIYNIAVFINKNTELLSETENVFLIDEIAMMLKQMNHESALTMFELFNVMQILNSSKRTASEVKAYMKKLNGTKTEYIVE